MRIVHDLIAKLARNNSTVLLTGESGTGKELAARSIHELSLRRDQSFVPVNCGAIPEELLESELFGCVRGAFTGAVNARQGRFQLAHRGTLFLDEIGEMSPKLQVKLLRVLQERQFEPAGQGQLPRHGKSSLLEPKSASRPWGASTGGNPAVIHWSPTLEAPTAAVRTTGEKLYLNPVRS